MAGYFNDVLYGSGPRLGAVSGGPQGMGGVRGTQYMPPAGVYSYLDLMGKDNDPRLGKVTPSNPYGQGKKNAIDFFRENNLRLDDPNNLARLRDEMAGYYGPHNPTGTEYSPYGSYWAKGEPSKFGKHMTPAEREQYYRSRYSYDNGLRSGLSNEISKPNGRTQNEAWDIV
jgi:hypothetical protein